MADDNPQNVGDEVPADDGIEAPLPNNDNPESAPTDVPAEAEETNDNAVNGYDPLKDEEQSDSADNQPA